MNQLIANNNWQRNPTL